MKPLCNSHPLRGVRRYMTNGLRKTLYTACLNREFDTVLKTLRTTSLDEVDHNLVQLLLMQGCRWAHVETIDFVWYKYVRRNESLLITPNMLCSMGNIAITYNKPFIPRDLYNYYLKWYGHGLRQSNLNEHFKWEYELLRIKVEMFSKSIGGNVAFREKWKVFLEDMDHRLPSECQFRFRDFPQLIKSYRKEYHTGVPHIGINGSNINEIGMAEYLFEDKKIAVINKTTLPLLLNIILIQDWIPLDNRINLFQKFYLTHPTLPFQDSLQILLHESDPYRLCELVDFTVNSIGESPWNDIINIQLRNEIQQKLQGTSLKYKLDKYIIH